MSDRVPFVVGILAIAGVVAWLVLRADDDTPPPPSKAVGSATLTAPPAPRATTTPREAPALPAQTEAPSAPVTGPTAEETFSTETRDDTWATQTERELAKRLTKLRAGTIESTECRQSQCRVVVAGSEHDVATAVADLEGPRGLHGYAQNVLLTSPDRKDDGSIALRVFVRFAR